MRVRFFGAALLLCFILTGAAAEPPVKNFIIMIPDGMSEGGVTLARWVNGGGPLAMDKYPAGLVRTYSSDALITDSAAAATALACGFKTQNGCLGVAPAKTPVSLPSDLPKLEQGAPMLNIMEAARHQKGMSTGIVVKCEFPHATPAGFSSHYAGRRGYDPISIQMINSGLDLLFAGGSEFVSKKRKDGFDLSKDIQELGYKYITTEAAMRTVTEPKVIGLFAPVAMMSEMDRRESGGSAEPSLAEMTQKAIDILSKNPKGFVLMVEGSKVDWAAHSHEPVGLVSEILAFNAALKAAADFAEKRGDTLILVCTDHGNGGVTVGPSEARGGPEAGVKLLQSIKITGAALAGKIAAIPEPSAEKIQALVREQWKISLDDAETAKILDSLAPAAERKNKSHESMESILGAALSRRTGVCWATPSHSGEDVTLRACGAGGKSFGLVNNTDIPKIAAAALGLDMSKTSSELFVEAHPAFLKKWAHAEEIKDVDGSPVTLIVTKGSDKLTLRVNSALCDFNGKKIRLPGPVIYTGVKLYVPAAALALIPESKAAPSPAAATAR